MTDRRAQGRFYTPAPVVQYIVGRTLAWADGRPPGELRILEPACGTGVFLQEAYRWLCAAAPRACAGGLWRGLFGVDRDPQALTIARQTLADEIEGRQATGAEVPACRQALAGQLRLGDALLDFDWPREFPQVFSGSAAGFDVVIGNPPYVNIRRLSHHQADRKDQLRARFRCARGAYDLYVLFVELAWQLLRPGGVCGMIVPNKIASLDYAAACRRLIEERTALLEITDLARCRVFPEAGVYPYVLIWRKEVPAARHHVAVIPIDSLSALAEPAVARRVAQSRLAAAAGGWQLHGSLSVEDRVASHPLRDVARVHSGTAGFQAAQLAELLREWQPDEDQRSFEFVVTGNVDRYLIRPGAVRFINRRFARPVLREDAPLLTENKRQLYRGPKILVAGMSRRLEAAWDPGGLALGVQLYAVVPHIDPYYLLALLNSKLISHLFRLRFQAKRLSGDYLSINKGQLETLPIRRIDADGASDRGSAAALGALARRMIGLAPAASAATQHQPAWEQYRALDRQIDQRVYRLYRLTPAEIETIEAGGSGAAVADRRGLDAHDLSEAGNSSSRNRMLPRD